MKIHKDHETRKNKIKTVILSLLVFSSLSSVSALDLNPDKVMKKILSLPPFMVHEDTVVSFRNMLKAGKFWIDGETNISYLLIKGDGTWGARLLMLHEDGKLYMVVYQGIIDGGGQKFSLYLYNEKEKAMVCIGSFEESLFGK